MGKEIERKYLIDIKKVGKLSNGIPIKQGYIETKDKTVVRIRIYGKEAYLTLKGANKGISRSEYEYEISIEDAQDIIDELCTGPVIDKTRYTIDFSEKTWEIDIFHGENEGLIVAEVELDSEQETIDLPDWVSTEVTGQEKYYNSNLLENPYKQWSKT